MSLPRGPHVKGSGADDVTGQDGPVTFDGLDRPSPVFLANITYRQAADPGPWKTDAPLTPSSSTDNSQCDEKARTCESRAPWPTPSPSRTRRGSRVCPLPSLELRLGLPPHLHAGLCRKSGRPRRRRRPQPRGHRPAAHPRGRGRSRGRQPLVALIIRNEHVVNRHLHHLRQLAARLPRASQTPVRQGLLVRRRPSAAAASPPPCGSVAFLVLLTRGLPRAAAPACRRSGAASCSSAT